MKPLNLLVATQINKLKKKRIFETSRNILITWFQRSYMQ